MIKLEQAPDAQRPVSPGPVAGADFKQQGKLRNEFAISPPQRRLAVPDAGGFPCGAVDFDNHEILTFLQFFKIRKAHIETAEIKALVAIDNSLDFVEKIVADQI